MQRISVAAHVAHRSVNQLNLDAKRALVIAEEGPVNAVYADVLKQRIKVKRKTGNWKAFGAREGYETERVNELYFTIMAHIQDKLSDRKLAGILEEEEDEEEEGKEDELVRQFSVDSDSDCEITLGDFEAENGEPLWHVVDSLVMRRAVDFHHDDRVSHRCENEHEDEPWNEFWEHYRCDGAKITNKDLALQRASNNSSALLGKAGRTGDKFTPRTGKYSALQEAAKARQEGAPTVAQRILQEYAAFEEHERQRVEGKQDEPWHSQKAREKAIASAHDKEASSSDSLEDDDLDEVNAVMHNSPLRRQRSRSLAASKSPSRVGAAEGANKKGGRRRFAHEFSEDSGLHKIQMAFDKKRRPPPVFIFGGFEDYKKWQDPKSAGRHDRGKKDLAEIAAESPQWKWSAAVREYETAAQWRRRGARHDEEVRKPLKGQSSDSECQHAVRLYNASSDKRNSTPRAALLPPSTNRRVTHVPTYTPHLGTPRAIEPPRMSMRDQISIPHSQKNLILSKSKKDPLCPPKPEFHRPWSREGNAHHHREDDSHEREEQLKSLGPMERYAKICKHTGVHPQPAIINFLAQLLPKLDVRGLGFGAEDVLSLAAALPYHGCIEAVDLGENPRVTDASACTLLRALASRHADTISAIKLDRCPRLGKEAISLCTYFLQQSLAEMQLLDMSGITIPLQEYGMLALAVKKHKRLRDIRLGDTGLGIFDKTQAHHVIANILGNKQLEALELGWNTLDTSAFATCGKSIVEHGTVMSLGLGNTGAKFDPVLNGPTILVFLEFLAFDKTLTNLDISSNSLDEASMQVLECAVSKHAKFEHIDVSRNALGIGGRRSVLRIIANTESGSLTKITADECRGGLPENSGKNPFVADPSGCYSKHMAQPAERALLRFLLRRFCEGPDALPPNKLFKNCCIRHDLANETPYSAESLFKLKNSVWEVPNLGELSFEFCCAESLLKDSDESSLPSKVVNDIVLKSRMTLTARRKTLAVLCIIKSEPDEQERDTWLEALGRDFILTPEQLRALCHTEVQCSSCAKDPAGTCVQLLPCLIGAKDVREAMLCTHNLGELVRVQKNGRWLLCLNLFAPNGHYHLHLRSPSDRAVAERLLLLNRWENQVWFAKGHMDISQHANQKNIRNEIYNNRQFVWSQEEWGIFGSDYLTFDYVSLNRPSKDAKPISDNLWKSILNIVQSTIEETLVGEFEDTICHDVDEKNKFRNARRKKRDRLSMLGPEYQNLLKDFGSKRCGWERSVAQPLSDTNVIFALRAVSSRIHVTCRQMREMVNIFHRREARVDVLVYYFLRILDWPLNSKMLRPALRDMDWAELRRRIGYINLFPFFQPENTWFQLDLSVYEQRRCLCFLKQLADAEHHKNIKFPRIEWHGNWQNPVWDTFVAGIPITWSSFENIATRGVFEATYTCSMDLVSMRLRRNLASKQAGWTHLPEDRSALQKQVLWWSVLDEVPREVVMVLEFFCSRYASLGAAFQDIDVNRDKSLTYREFISGMKRRMRDIGFGSPRLTATYDTVRSETTSGIFPSTKMRTIEEKKLAPKASTVGKKLDPVEGEAPGPCMDDDRLTEILHITFKFLDPNNDAELSSREFGVLEGIWRELKLTTWEFMQHLIDCFGSLENAWAYADEDENLVLTLEEFESLATRWSFYGPVRHIFMHLDTDDSGSISHREWRKLEAHEPPTFPDYM